MVVVISLHGNTAVAAGQSNVVTCAIGELPGLAAQFARATRLASGAEFDREAPERRVLGARAADDFWRVTMSVIGASRDSDSRSGVEGVGLPSLSALPCDPVVRARDRVAWSMVSVGYSAREIADVIDGHLTRADLDQAYARTMAGHPRSSVAAFLESRWQEPRRAVDRRAESGTQAKGISRELTSRGRVLPTALASELAAHAQRYRVDPALIHAVIAAESAGNPRALSPAGAIGLMQLMPATAAALGVNPWNPVENLRGGIAYLSSLLSAYAGDVRLALIAYNAGPQHADRVRDGRAVAYRETRQYLDAIAARYPLQ